MREIEEVGRGLTVDDLDTAAIDDRLLGCGAVACDVRHARLHAARAAANVRATVRLLEGMAGEEEEEGEMNE